MWPFGMAKYLIEKFWHNRTAKSGKLVVSLFGLKVYFSVTADKEKKLGLAEIFVRQEEVNGTEKNVLIWAQS